MHVISDCANEIPTRVTSIDECNFTPNASYVHLTSNETISGAQWKTFPENTSPIVADMSSDILSKPLDISNFGLIMPELKKILVLLVSP